MRKVNWTVIAFLLCVGCGAVAVADSVKFRASHDFSATNNPNGTWSYGYYPAPLTLTPPITTGVSFNTANFVLFTRTLKIGFPPLVTPSGVPVTTPIDVWLIDFVEPGNDPDLAHNPSTVDAQDRIPPPHLDTVFPAKTLVFHPGPGFKDPAHPTNPIGRFSVVRWTAPSDGKVKIKASFYGTATAPTSTDVHVLFNGTSFLNGNAIVHEFGPAGKVTFKKKHVPVAKGDKIEFVVGNGVPYITGDTGYTDDSTALAAVIKLFAPDDDEDEDDGDEDEDDGDEGDDEGGDGE